MTADRLVRWTAVLAVLAVAAVAALISYHHAVEVVTAHGQGGILGQLYPAAIDELIIAASMVLLDAARNDDDQPALAWWMLGAGIGVTLAVNVLAGLSSGWLGAVIAAWPAAAFVGCCELLMLLVRASARRNVGSTDVPDVPGGVPDPFSGLNGHREKAAGLFAADIEAGTVPGIRRIRDGLHVGQPKAVQVQAYLRTLISDK